MALAKRAHAAELRWDKRAGILATVIAGPWTEQDLGPSDFYPSLKKLERRAAMSGEEVVAFVKTASAKLARDREPK